MLAKTHIMGGVAAGLGAATILPHDPIFLTASAALGALIPDICHTGSTIGRKMPLLSSIISTIFGHRTFTHSLVFLGLAAWLMFSLPIFPSISFGILAGMVSHLVLDGMTKNGIKLLWPMKQTFRMPLAIRTGGPMEPIVFAALAVLSIYWGLDVFKF